MHILSNSWFDNIDSCSSGRITCIKAKDPSTKKLRGLSVNMAATYSPALAVPSAMRGLTSLFGMGRGEHPRQYHHKIFSHCLLDYNNIDISGTIDLVLTNMILKKLVLIYPSRVNKVKAYVQLVLLGFDVTTFTPVAYQRHRL